jgi:hypothetical protein
MNNKRAPRRFSGAGEHEMTSHPERKSNGKEIHVVVTTVHRGVFAGYASETNSKTINLRAARNCIYWPSSVGGFVGLATGGPNSQTKIGPAADMVLHDVTAVLKCTPEAEKAWIEAKWKF